MVACYNRQLAEQRRHKRQELLAATQAEWKPGSERGATETAADIGVRPARLSTLQMAKHSL